jgi:alcohol dehydrogenase class IV
MFLPAVVQFNASAKSIQKEMRLERMAQAMGGLNSSDLPAALTAMNERLGLPAGLSHMGITSALFESIVNGALADHCHATNPRLASADDYIGLLEKSM